MVWGGVVGLLEAATAVLEVTARGEVEGAEEGEEDSPPASAIAVARSAEGQRQKKNPKVENSWEQRS